MNPMNRLCALPPSPLHRLTMLSLFMLAGCVPPDSRYDLYGAADECVYDEDCADTAYCFTDDQDDPYAPSVCLPVCIDDFDCGEGLRCDQDFGECVPGCNEIYDCETGSYCDPSSRRTAVCLPGCQSDLNCGATGAPGEIPDLICIAPSRREVGSCTLTCQSDRECEDGTVCVFDSNFDEELSFGVCLAGCENDRACSAGEVCDLSQQLCVPGCRSERDCESGVGRDEPVELCIVPEGEEIGRCEGSCAEDSECNAQFSCLPSGVDELGYCAPNEGCDEDQDCDESQRCMPTPPGDDLPRRCTRVDEPPPPPPEDMSPPQEDMDVAPGDMSPPQEDMRRPRGDMRRPREDMAPPAEEDMAPPVEEDMAPPMEEDMAPPAEEDMAPPEQESAADMGAPGQ